MCLYKYDLSLCRTGGSYRGSPTKVLRTSEPEDRRTLYLRRASSSSKNDLIFEESPILQEPPPIFDIRLRTT